MFWRYAVGTSNMFGGVTPATASILSHATLAQDIVSYYALNTDGSVPDRTNRFDGTNSGATYTTSGKISGAYDFDGANDLIDLNKVIDVNIFSISLWVKQAAASDTHPDAIISQYDSDEDFSQDFRLTTSRFETANTNHLDPALDADTNWHHIVIVINGSSSQFYKDGSKMGSDFTNSADFTSGTSRVLQLGAKNGGDFWAGSISDVGIWDKALTSTEITDLYASGNGLPWQPLPFRESSTLHQNLVAAYNMEGQSVVDYWGTHNSTSNNGSVVTGKIDNAIFYDGVQYTDIPAAAFPFNDSSSWTVSFWFNADDVTIRGQPLSFTSGTNIFGMGLNVGSVSGALSFSISKSGTVFWVADTGNILSNDTWYNCILTCDGTNVYCYINNNLESSDESKNGSGSNIHSGDTMISRNHADYSFDGEIDEFMIWSKVLSSDERAEIYALGNGLRFRAPFQGHATLTTDLVEYFTFRNVAKSDVSGTTGTVTGPTYITDGPMENAYSFATNDFIDPGSNNFGITEATDWTIAFWFRTTSGGANECFYGKYDGATDIFFINTASGYVRWRMGHAGGDEINVTSTTTAVNDGNWHFLTATWNTTTNAYEMKVDGVVEISGTATISEWDDANYYDIGRRSDASQYYNGDMAEFGIWSRVLTDEEITDLYNNGIGLRFY